MTWKSPERARARVSLVCEPRANLCYELKSVHTHEHMAVYSGTCLVRTLPDGYGRFWMLHLRRASVCIPPSLQILVLTRMYAGLQANLTLPAEGNRASRRELRTRVRGTGPPCECLGLSVPTRSRQTFPLRAWRRVRILHRMRPYLPEVSTHVYASFSIKAKRLEARTSREGASGDPRGELQNFDGIPTREEATHRMLR